MSGGRGHREDRRRGRDRSGRRAVAQSDERQGSGLRPSERFRARADRGWRIAAAHPEEGERRRLINIREIDHLVLRVRDLSRMLDFYCGLLGCVVERRQDELGLTQLRAGRSMIDLVTVGGAPGKMGGSPPAAECGNLDHLCLRVEPFDGEAILAYLRAHGVEEGEISSRYGAEGEGPSIYINDPEGNVVELKGPPWA